MLEQGLGVRGWGLATWGRGTAIVLTMLVASQTSFAGNPTAHQDEGNLGITVRVYDYVQVSPEILAEAEKEAARILDYAGIRTEWLACSVGQAEEKSDAACERPFGPNDLIMRILPRSMAARLPFRNNTLGFALLTEEGGQGYVAAVLYHKAERLAEETGMDRYHVLAHAIAHEIGHLLLRTLKHNGRGLMGANWGPEDLQLACRGLLPFTPQEATQLRAEIRARVSVAALHTRTKGGR